MAAVSVSRSFRSATPCVRMEFANVLEEQRVAN